MPEYCTCGARLPDDARFCHRCGRPTVETEPAETPVLAPPPLPRETAAPKTLLPVGFGNPVALRAAFMMAIGVVFFTPFALAAGWGSVLLYRRFSGIRLDTRAGAYLGSITGVLSFTGLTVILTITLPFTLSQKLAELSAQSPQLAEAVHNPLMVAFGLVTFLFLFFCFLVTICAASGALGARFVSRRP